MHKTIFLFLIVVALGSMTACKRTLPDFGHTAVVKLANNWWVTPYATNYGFFTGGPVFFTTYNSSSNSADSLWLDDLKLGYGFKTEVTANYAKLTFSSTNSPNQYQGDSVTVFNAKVITLGGHSKTGVPTDSLYFQALFSDDPGDTLTVAGTARTGIIADDY
jgi:hypothetical protein